MKAPTHVDVMILIKGNHMPVINFSPWNFAAFLTAVFITSSASADNFKPMKFLQHASAIAAIASAVSQLDTCEGDLGFSEKRIKSNDGNNIVVTVSCNKFPDDNGKLVRSVVRVEMELDEDGGIGAPLGYYYE